ncbi:MAG: helix-turn-helix transcriptional regulator [Thermomicrobiales bacterium]
MGNLGASGHDRLEHGLTQAALAERAGLSVRGVSDLERGRLLDFTASLELAQTLLSPRPASSR